MKIFVLSLMLASAALFTFGCQSTEGSDLTKEDKVKMDKLFREGIKNPPSGGPAKKGVPLNAPADE